MLLLNQKISNFELSKNTEFEITIGVKIHLLFEMQP